MVNAGRRSKCCTACRERRVKCDLQKPYCRRCTQAGRPCPGYPDAWSVVLRVQNDYAKNKVHSRVQKVMTKRIEQAERKRAIPQGPSITVEVHSWNRFYLDYATHSGIKLFHVLPKFYASSSSTCFQEALKAVALSSSAHQLHQSGLMVMARRCYGKAITSLNAALNDPVLAADDSVLVTMFLLSLFEMIVPECFRTDRDFHCHIHFRGSLLLLQWRAERAQDCELDQSFFKFLSHICLMSMFLNHEPFDVKWSVLVNFAAPWAKGPLLEPILERAVDFKRRACHHLKTGHPQSRSELIQLITEGIILSEDLGARAISIKSAAHPDLYPFQEPRAFNDLFEVSTKTTEIIAQSLYHTIQYHVVELIMGLSDCIMQQGNGLNYELDYRIDPSLRLLILEQICGEIGAVLGSDSAQDVQKDNPGMAYRAYGMFWPMLSLLSSSLIGLEKVAWIRQMLQSSGEVTGFGLATWTAERISMLRPYA